MVRAVRQRLRHGGRHRPAGGAGRHHGGSAAEPAGEELLLADSGSVDTTPYLVGGTAFLLVGASFVAYSARRGPWVTEDAGLT